MPFQEFSLPEEIPQGSPIVLNGGFSGEQRFLLQCFYGLCFHAGRTGAEGMRYQQGQVHGYAHCEQETEINGSFSPPAPGSPWPLLMLCCVGGDIWMTLKPKLTNILYSFFQVSFHKEFPSLNEAFL